MAESLWKWRGDHSASNLDIFEISTNFYDELMYNEEADEVFEIAIWLFFGEKSPIWQFFDE